MGGRRRRRGRRRVGLGVDFVSVLQGRVDRGHVGLDGLGPGLHVAKVLQGRVEAVDQLQPVGSLENRMK